VREVGGRPFFFLLFLGCYMLGEFLQYKVVFDYCFWIKKINIVKIKIYLVKKNKDKDIKINMFCVLSK